MSQELFTLQFECRPLGLELEMCKDKVCDDVFIIANVFIRYVRYNDTTANIFQYCQNCQIICARVLEDSQASGYEEALEGAEIVAIDDQRISSLEDFQFIVSTLRTKGLGPRLQFIRNLPKVASKKPKGASRSSLDSLPGKSGHGRGGGALGANNTTHRDIQAFDNDDSLVAAVKTSRPVPDVAPRQSWSYATSFGVELAEPEEEDNNESGVGLGPKHLVCIAPNMSKKV